MPTHIEQADAIARILDNITDAFFAVDSDWRFAYANPEAEQLLLRGPGELVGKNIWQFLPDTVGSVFEAQLQRAGREKVMVAFQLYYPSPLDSWHEVRAYPSRSGAGLSVSFRNITEERHKTEERQHLVAELQATNARLEGLLGSILPSLTEGRFEFCTTYQLPYRLPPLPDSIELSKSTLRVFREQIRGVADRLDYLTERIHDFLTACNEAAMNAFLHARGGTARVHGDLFTGRMQVWVQDQGVDVVAERNKRVIMRNVPIVPFGQGFFLMNRCADHVYLRTELSGTTVVLEQERQV